MEPRPRARACESVRPLSDRSGPVAAVQRWKVSRRAGARKRTEKDVAGEREKGGGMAKEGRCWRIRDGY
jgi:hypothetical protein